MSGGPRRGKEVRDRSAASDRAAAFLFVHDLFRLPTPEQWAWIGKEETRRPWEALAAALGAPGPGEITLPSDEGSYESGFLSAFETGAPTPAVPLMESHYEKRGTTGLILQENVLFYRRFGLRLRGGSAENADHLRSQLEFVAHLYRMEAGAPADADGGGRIESIRRGRSEYMERHLSTWLPAAEKRAENAAPPWAAAYVAIACRLVEAVADAPSPSED